jgi:hypothetical protein
VFAEIADKIMVVLDWMLGHGLKRLAAPSFASQFASLYRSMLLRMRFEMAVELYHCRFVGQKASLGAEAGRLVRMERNLLRAPWLLVRKEKIERHR